MCGVIMNFYEHEPISLYLDNLEEIENVHSQKQSISLMRHPWLGKVLVINGEIQHIEAYQALYHELLVHLPIAFLPSISSALIIGGGSLFAAYELLKYPSLKRVTLCDHDHEVLDLVTRHYPHAQIVLNDRRFNYVEDDGWKYCKRCHDRYDLVVNDCFNLVEESKKLNFSCYDILSNLCTDSGVCVDIIYRHIFDRKITEKTLSYLHRENGLALALVTVPEYPGILHIETIWSKSHLVSQLITKPVNSFQRDICDGKISSPFQFFSPKHLGFYLYLPPYIRTKFNL